ncbi:MAG: hypothetical protein ACE5FA_10350, partial [Dehalococcoidia bacterium]
MIDNGKDLKIALVGGGAIAENFYLPALSVRPGMIEKAVLVERDERRAEELAGKLFMELAQVGWT